MSTLVTGTIKSNTTNPPLFQNTSGTEIGTLCRAWVNFNGTLSSPITPRASYNVSTVTKNGTGDYTITFTTAMPDENYSIAASCGGTSGIVNVRGRDESTQRTVSAARLLVFNTSFAAADSAQVNVSIFR